MTAPITDYIGSSDLKSALGIGTGFADAQIAAAITSASRLVDDMTNRTFGKGAAGEVRYYTPISPEFVLIDDVLTVTSVVSRGNTLVDGTDYTLDKPEQRHDWPWTTIRSLYPLPVAPYSYLADRGPSVYGDAYGVPGIFTRSFTRSVVVTGTFGWNAVPDVVKMATTILASRLLNRIRQSPMGVYNFDMSGFAVRVPGVDPDVDRLLHAVTRARWEKV